MAQTTHIDLQTARNILAGDDATFRELFDRFFPRLYRFAKVRLDGDHDAACDVVQQTFCKAIDNLDSYRGEAALYTWFCQICRNTLIDYCRARNRRMQQFVLLEDNEPVRAILETLAGPAVDQPETQTWRSDVGRLVQATVDALPTHYGDVLEWKYVDGLTVKEIASRLSIGTKAAESLLTRARAGFRDALGEMLDSTDDLTPPSVT